MFQCGADLWCVTSIPSPKWYNMTWWYGAQRKWYNIMILIVTHATSPHLSYNIAAEGVSEFQLWSDHDSWGLISTRLSLWRLSFSSGNGSTLRWCWFCRIIPLQVYEVTGAAGLFTIWDNPDIKFCVAQNDSHISFLLSIALVEFTLLLLLVTHVQLAESFKIWPFWESMFLDQAGS